ncbi:uncharacterized protein LOC122965674 isoform X1 [Thunnus albacares]|uniref:uncharacterized protein LOC122965674 isoform X1 n=2 Tax=Thunnus albacares TaxID=8236 RepID=UPI001CF6F793|nr:uncharacterized protein LOC122965674 isoform X1 [Thunnus albacares]
MKTVAFIIGLFIGYKFTDGTTAEDAGSPGVQWACRDRYLWIHVTSGQTPRFEAVDENGVHSISKQLASRCGYTISSFKMDGLTTFRASYYSCFTHNQNDEAFTFRFNVMVSDGGAGWISRPVSAICSGLSWSHREIVCEEDYMEVNVNRESSCGGQRGESGQVWQTAFSQAQRTASAAWQLMFLQSDGQVNAMSISEAQTQGYSLTATAKRVVFRSQYSPPHAEMMMVDGVPVEVVRVSLFFKQKLMVVMIDVSVVCTVNSGSFDGTRLLWDIPRVLTPLVGEGATFESRSLSLGVEGVLLDQHTASTRGFSLIQQGGLVQIQIPFGAEGGYRKSLVVNNVYKETYVIFLLYEHIFSLLYEDGSSVDTRHRLLRVLDTPLLCRPPFSLDQTVSDDQVFRVYLGNIPADVVLEEVHINGKPLLSDTPERGIGISPVVHVNGSQAYELQLPFEDTVVQWTNLGEGVVQYSIDINFTLTIMPQRESYYHHTLITAQAFNTYPPEITAQCSDGGITFSVVRPPRAESLWEVGVDQEPLTPQLAAQRGYHLHSDSHKTTLEVPVFSIGYTYEGINLSNFYGTFKLLLRDSKTLEVQTSTSKHCLFKTEDMIVCSADGTMTVVTTPTSTWPTVQPERTSLLDPSCGPKQTDRSRVLFEFKLDSCGTRAMVGDSYVVYENEILHDRQLIADGPNFISRESQFKLTVRCFYPLSGVNRLSVDRLFRSETSGFGSIKVFESLKDSTNKLTAHDCSHQASENAINILSKQVQHTPQTPATGGVLPHPGIRPQPRPGPSSFITAPGGHKKLFLSSQNHQTFPNINPSPPHEVPLQVPAHRGHFMSQTEDQHVFGVEPNLSPFTSSIVGIEMANTGERSGYQPQSQYDPSQTPQLYPVLQTPAQYSQDHISRNKLPLPGIDTTYVPTVDVTSTNTIPDFSGNTLVTPQHLSTESHETKVHQNPERTGSIERRNVKTIQSRVQNIRVKPLRKLASSGHHLSQKPSIPPAYLRSSSPSQYATVQTAASSDGDHWMSQQVSDHRGSNTINWTHSPERPGTLRQEQGVKVKPDQSAGIRLTSLSPNQQGHQQKLVQSVAETGNSGGQQSTPRKVLQPAGASRIRVRPAPGPPGRLQTPDQSRLQNLYSVTGEGTSRTPSFSFTLQNVPKSPSSIIEYKPTNPNTPSPGSHTGPGGSGSDLKTNTRSDCSGQYGDSVHWGIMRGTNTRSLHLKGARNSES